MSFAEMLVVAGVEVFFVLLGGGRLLGNAMSCGTSWSGVHFAGLREDIVRIAM